MVRTLAAGPGLLAVWETLDETGAVETFLPEWERVRLLPHASGVHRFTVDRHMVETCIEASALIRRVARPDVLMAAALLHDIGKGRLTEHCVAGEPVAREVSARMGFDEREVDLVGHLVRWHLLLPETATTRDPDDPVTVQTVTDRVPDREELLLLMTLTEADARATSEKAWTSWRAGLVRQLFRRAMGALTDTPPEPDPSHPDLQIPGAVLEDPERIRVEVRAAGDGSEVTVVSGDRVGLLADAAAMIALQRISVRAARAWTVGDVGGLAVAGGGDRAGRARAPAAPGEHRRGPRRRDVPPGPSYTGAAGADRGGAPGGVGARRRSSRCARRTGRASSTRSAARSPTSASRCGPRTSPRSGRRRSTCSTCRRAGPAR